MDTLKAHLHADLYWPVLCGAAFYPVHPLIAAEDLEYHTSASAPVICLICRLISY